MENTQLVSTEEISALMEAWQVPGLGLGIVHQGNVLYSGGIGKRDVAQDLAMTEQTVIPIGSTTKTFTSMALGMLADEGLFDWDTPVRQYVPWFQMYDDTITNRVTGRDLLSHRTGVAGHDLQAALNTKTRKELVESIRYLQPNSDFRTRLQYQNQMVALAGYVIEALTGMTWEQFIQTRVFDKLGMDRSVFTLEEMQSFDEYSKPYLLGAEGLQETNYIPIVSNAPAGAINSTVEDMTSYLQLLLAKGSYKGEALVSEAQLTQAQTAQMLGSPYYWSLDEFQATNYGLGWFVDIYRGHTMLSHGGNTRGFSSLMTILPEQEIGIIALSNANVNFMIYALTYTIADRILGVEAPDWSSKIQEALGAIFGGMAAAQEQKAQARIADTSPSHPLEEYAGVYTHPAYGDISISLQGAALCGNYNGYPMDIMHYHYDSFDVVIKAMDVPALITFETNPQGEIYRISAPLEPSPGVDPIVFVRS